MKRICKKQYEKDFDEMFKLDKKGLMTDIDCYVSNLENKNKRLQQENKQLKLINKEHQQINGELRQANKLLNEQYIRLYKEYEQQERIKYLERSNNRREDTILEQRQEISDLYKDYMQLKAQIEEYQKALDETMSEKIDIENNWNKLKEYIRKNIIYDDVGMKILDPSPLEDYIQELEQGSDSDE